MWESSVVAQCVLLLLMLLGFYQFVLIWFASKPSTWMYLFWCFPRLLLEYWLGCQQLYRNYVQICVLFIAKSFDQMLLLYFLSLIWTLGSFLVPKVGEMCCYSFCVVSMGDISECTLLRLSSKLINKTASLKIAPAPKFAANLECAGCVVGSHKRVARELTSWPALRMWEEMKAVFLLLTLGMLGQWLAPSPPPLCL